MPIPSEIKKFVARYVGSVQQLEVLLAMASEPNRDWTAEEVGKKVDLDITAVTNRLLSLRVKELITCNEKALRTFRYSPKDKDAYVMVQKLRMFYGQEPTKLLEFIYSRAESRIRDFSDAFRLNQEDENG